MCTERESSQTGGWMLKKKLVQWEETKQNWETEGYKIVNINKKAI